METNQARKLEENKPLSLVENPEAKRVKDILQKCDLILDRIIFRKK